MFPSNILESYFLMQQVESPKAQDILVDVGAGNGIEIYLNGKSVMKHLNPYRCKFREEKVLLPLQKGSNQIVVRIYNRFEKKQAICCAHQRNRLSTSRNSLCRKWQKEKFILLL